MCLIRNLHKPTWCNRITSSHSTSQTNYKLLEYTKSCRRQKSIILHHCVYCVPGMTVCLKSSSLRCGRKQTIRSQVISHKSENPVLESVLWKIPAVSITSSMFFRDSGIASNYTQKNTEAKSQIQSDPESRLSL